MKSVYFLVAALLALPQLASAASSTDVYDGYCLINLLKKVPGEPPPQGEVKLKKGESKELYNLRGYSYQVKYETSYGGKGGVINLYILRPDKKKYVTITAVHVAENKDYPPQIDLVVKGFGGISCMHWD